MAITFDTASTTNGAATSYTFSHTVNAGANKLLLVGFSSQTSTNPAVSAVTFNGTPLTRVGIANDGTLVVNEIWYLKDPTSTTANVVVTANSSDRAAMGAVSYFGVDQTTTFGNQGTTSGSTATPSVAVTSTKNGSWMFGNVASRYNETITSGAGQTQRYIDSATGGGAQKDATVAGDDEPVPTSGTLTTMSYTIGNARNNAVIVQELLEAVTARNFGFIL